MNAKEKSQITNLQMVEIDQSKFAIEVKDGEVRANLTQMAKPFGRRPADWLKTEEAKSYLVALSVTKKIVTADLVKVRNGGRPNEQGTWAYDHNVLIEFARWLNPMLSVQVNELVWKLLSGKAAILEPQLPLSASESELVELIDKASLILGSQNRLANRLGFSSSVFSHARTMPYLIGDFRKKQIEALCRKVISEGAGYIPNIRSVEPQNVDMSDILVDVCRIENTDVRLSLLSKLTGGMI